MTFTMDRTISVVAPHFPAALVSPSALDWILALTRQMPAALTCYAGFECRLGSSASRVDVVFDVAYRARKILAGRDPVLELPPHFLEHTAWQRVRRLCQDWMDPRSSLYEAIRGVWLEFDLDRAPSGTPIPGIFVRFEGGVPKRPSLPESLKYRLLTESALPVLLGRPLHEATKVALRTCFEELPAGAQLTEAGLMLQRDSNGAEAVRLCFKHPPEQQIPAYLQRVGWPGAPGPLKATLDAFSRENGPGRMPTRVGYLDIDVGATVQPTIGLEYFLDTSGRQVVDGPLEKRWLESLVQQGLCAPEKRGGLLDWPGYMQMRMPHELWPSIVVRNTHHVKIVYTPDQPLTAKAYLSFYHRFFKRAERTESPMQIAC